MKTILRAIFLNLITLYLVSLFFPGLKIEQAVLVFLSAAVVWTFLNKIIKPLIKLLLLPINLITLGLFSWVVNVLTLFLLQYFIKGVSVVSFISPGFEFNGFVVPTLHFNLFLSYIITSIILHLTHMLVVWLVRSS